jgi:hypothetical protein
VLHRFLEVRAERFVLEEGDGDWWGDLEDGTEASESLDELCRVCAG